MSITAPLRLLAYTASYIGSDLPADLAAIREASTRNNPAAGITGALVYDRGRFIQAVEGPAEGIERLLERVTRDTRAADMTVLFDATTPTRSLQEWSMRVFRVDTADAVDPATLAAFRDAYVRNFRPDAAGFLDLFRALVTTE